MLECKITGNSPEAIRAQRRQLLTYVRATGTVNCAIAARAWSLGITNNELYALAGAGIAERQIAQGNKDIDLLAELGGDADAFVANFKPFVDGFNAAMQYRKLAAQMEG